MVKYQVLKANYRGPYKIKDYYMYMRDCEEIDKKQLKDPDLIRIEKETAFNRRIRKFVKCKDL